MSLKNRVGKIEQQTDNTKIPVVIVVGDGETEEQAYQRCFPDDRAKPKRLVYLMAGDEYL
jgi:threonyl-tRNA synthetase